MRPNASGAYLYKALLPSPPGCLCPSPASPFSELTLPTVSSQQGVGDLLSSVLTDLDFDKEKFFGLVIDDCSFAPALLRNLPSSSMKHVCVGHRLQTTLRKAFQRGLDQETSIAALIASAKATVRHIRNSSDLRSKLQAKCDANQLQMPKTFLELNPVRWNALLQTVESVLSVRQALEPLLNNTDLPAKVLGLSHPSAFDLLDQLIAPLALVRRISVALSDSSEPTLRDTVSAILHLKKDIINRCANDQIDDRIKTILRCILEALATHFETFSELETMALVLDPRARPSMGDDEWRSWYQQGVEALRSYDYPDPLPALPALHDLDDDGWLPPRSIDISFAVSIDAELEHYLNGRPLPKSTDILEWWTNWSFEYPRLSYLARRLLCIPAAQTVSEADFSLMKRLCIEHKLSFDPRTANKQRVSQLVAARSYRDSSKDKVEYRHVLAESRKYRTREAHQRKWVAHRGLQSLLGPSRPSSLMETDDSLSDDWSDSDTEDTLFEEEIAPRKRKQNALPEDTPAARYAPSDQETLSLTKDKPYVEFDACSDAGELILAFFGNLSFNFVTDWESILGPDYPLFCDFAPTSNCSHPIVQWGMKLSPKGKEKFELGRREAIDRIGPLKYL